MRRLHKTRKSRRLAPLLTPLSPHISPLRDFYGYVDSVWDRRTQIPSYAHTIGVSEEIEEAIKRELIDALHNVQVKTPHLPLSLFVKSLMDADAQHRCIETLQTMSAQFAAIKTPDDLGTAIGQLNRIQCHAPLSFVVSSDSNDSRRCMVFVYEPELALPEKHLYTGHAHQDTAARTALDRLFAEGGRQIGCPGLADTVGLERGLLSHLTPVEDRKDITFLYNPVSYTHLESTYPKIPWKSMLTTLGCSAHVLASARFIITNEKWLHHFQTLLRTLSYPQWAAWMTSQLVATFAEYLPSPLRDLQHELYGHLLRGNKEPLPKAHRMLKAFQTFAPQALSRIFVEETLPPGTKQEATKLVESLKDATGRRIQGLAWMSDETKAHALDKLRAMRFQVAYPDVWTSEFDKLRVEPGQPLQTIFALTEADTETMLDDLRRGNCGKSDGEWEEGAFEVNAYYYPDGNMMTIPGGILKPPFFDLKRSRAWNLGGIGAAVGHEITHGFDDDGRKFDAHGNYKSWWQPSDAETYEKMSKEMETLYDKQHTAYGKVNGKHTLSENLADLGGVAIALEALKSDLKGASEKDVLQAYREFFISYAVSWRTKQRPEKAKQALLLDRHAPAPLRVNLIVAQFAEFYKAFGGTLPPKPIVFW
jgi:predicted metalloendopeptidase